MSAESSTIEFEAPPSALTSAMMSPSEKKHYSIDLSLELERQLDAESLPPTPAPHAVPPEPHPQQMPFQLPDIDPHVLAHIISQLRHQLADMTKERDDLLVLLSAAHSKEADLTDSLQGITEKAVALEKQHHLDEETISMLRTKVEESRRGLMRLQAESRRQSVQPGAIDVTRANAPSAFSLGPTSSKRASFTPLTGTFSARPNGHRRISSVSDSNVALMITDASPISPEHSSTIAAPTPANNRRLSGFFGRSSPPQPPPLALSPSPSPDELEKLRKEIKTLQDALDETRHELSEANEAREASETCVGALREFIAENNLGTGEVKLPPLPAATTGEEPDTNSLKKDKGWGFKLWKVDTSVNRATGPASSTTATGSPVIPPAVLGHQSSQSVSASGPPPVALSRKLTGFFSSRTSVSSVAPSLAPLQTHRDSMYSASDASSVAEPISPTSQVSMGGEVRVRDAAAGSPDLAGSSPEGVEAAKEAHTPVALGEDDASMRSVNV